MSMKELEIYLKRLQLETLPFSREEISEPLITVYDIVEWAVRDQCTIIEISDRRIMWKRELRGKTIGEFPTPISLKPYFQLIVDRDPMLQTHLRLIGETGRKVTYRIDG